MSIFVDALKGLLLTVVTNRCEICGEVIELDERLCDDCKKLIKIKSPRCKYCGYSKEDCNCNKHKNEYKQIVAPFYYEKTIVKAVHNFKDNKMPFLSKGLCTEMISVINECYSDIDFDYITYIPLRKLKQIKRGYNQSELLANGISEALEVANIPILEKVRYTGVQHFKSAKERKADIFGAFDVRDEYKSLLKDKTILIVDDVKTTGSTLNECAKMLNIYGASGVYAVTFALTRKK